MHYIPKVIHYFWFGRGEKSESVKHCIESWKSICPDYKIIEWNEDNYNIHKHPFMEMAYRDKKWAFVSDYARLDILYKYGGIYLDTDVELLKSLNPLLCNQAFMGFEKENIIGDGAGFGCMAGLPVFKEMMACYDNLDEYIESPRLRTKVLIDNGLVLNGKRQSVAGIEIYPTEYFCPKNYMTGVINVSYKTFSIHHFQDSWHDGNSKYYTNIMRFLNRKLGEENGYKMYQRMMRAKDKIKDMAGMF